MFGIIYTKNDYHKKYDNDKWDYDFENNIEYYKGYLVHREDGPAIEWSNCTKSWYKNGQYHREDGPAIEWSDGDKSWYLNGIEYSEEEYNKIMNIKRNKRILNEIY